MTEAKLDRHGQHIVLCGSLRAGTTLLRLLIGQHSQVHGQGESDFLFDGAPEEGGGTAEELKTFFDKVAASRSTKAQGITPSPGKTYEEMLDDLLGQHRTEGKRLLITTHRHHDVAAKFLPNAVFVRLQRDPRDVALSAKAMGWGGVPYRSVSCWIDSEASWLAAEPHLTSERQVFVRYEDLTGDPEKEMRRILEAVGLPFEEAVLVPSGSTYSAPKPRAPEQFRTRLTEREIAEINSRVALSSESYGYDLTPAYAPKGIRKAQLTVEGSARQFAFAAKRYGFVTQLASVLGRKLKLGFLSDYAQPRIQKKVVEHLK
ncbi:sulfotransferase family protein [Parvularcula maris]|uniref:Sulfotransferase n=1 Tax=Parvularcula maris TaxID=2965077 RepID=A0A9X2L713_9PROT|nr:sulfotransferase [Parvularcula maris]MCQ8184339.1 sulfotransferase [Parvularcula maris]